MGKRKLAAESDGEEYDAFRVSASASTGKLKSKSRARQSATSCDLEEEQDIKPSKRTAKKRKASSTGPPIETRQARFRTKCPKVC